MVFNTGAALLDAIVLAVVAKEPEGTYGYKITQDVRSVIELSESTLYPVLRRLQKDDCLVTYDKQINGRNRRYYKITDEGKEMLASLQSIIPDFIILRIDEKIEDSEKEIKQKSVVFADFAPEGRNAFMVKCKISEGGKKLIEINLSVPTREQAIDICNKWYESPSKYYLEIIKMFGSN